MRAVELFLDEAADRRVRRLWDDLEAIGVPSLASRSHHRHRPHISLLVGDVVPEAAVTGMGDLLPRSGELGVSLGSVAVFPGREGVLYLCVVPTEELLRTHARLVEHLADFDAEPIDLYRVGRWSPHCTLAQDLSAQELGRAVAHLVGTPQFDAVITAAGLADTTTGAVEMVVG